MSPDEIFTEYEAEVKAAEVRRDERLDSVAQRGRILRDLGFDDPAAPVEDSIISTEEASA